MLRLHFFHTRYWLREFNFHVTCCSGYFPHCSLWSYSCCSRYSLYFSSVGIFNYKIYAFFFFSFSLNMFNTLILYPVHDIPGNYSLRMNPLSHLLFPMILIHGDLFSHLLWDVWLWAHFPLENLWKFFDA